MSGSIFISYSSQSRHRAASLARLLQARGYEVWWDRQLEATSTPYPKQIWDQLLRADCVVVLWCATSIESGWVNGEAEEARASSKIVSCVVEDVRLRPPFNILQTISLIDWHGDDRAPQFQKLLESVQRFAGMPTLTDDTASESVPSRISGLINQRILTHGRFDSGWFKKTIPGLTSLRWGPRPSLLATIGSDKVILWDVGASVPLCEARAPTESYICDGVFDSEGEAILVRAVGELLLYRVGDGRLLARSDKYVRTEAIAFGASPPRAVCGNRLAKVEFRGDKINLTELRECIWPWVGAAGTVGHIEISHSDDIGGCVAIYKDHEQGFYFDVLAREKIPLGASYKVKHIAISPDGRKVAVATSDEIVVWSVDGPQEELRVESSWPSLPLCFSSNGETLAFCSNEELWLLHIESKERVAAWAFSKDRWPWMARFSACDTRFAIACHDGAARIFDVAHTGR